MSLTFCQIVLIQESSMGLILGPIIRDTCTKFKIGEVGDVVLVREYSLSKSSDVSWEKE